MTASSRTRPTRKPDTMKTPADSIADYFLGDWHIANVALEALNNNGFHLVRDGQAVHDGVIYDLVPVNRTGDWTRRLAWLRPITPTEETP